MNRKCMCMLRNYSSPHSKTVSDRIVEPFLFMNNGLDIRCHEIKSHTNKTFKLARIGEVELLDVEWIAEKEHKQVFTDLFMFSGEERHAVTLLLDQLARNLIVEEYPASATCISPVDDDPHFSRRRRPAPLAFHHRRGKLPRHRPFCHGPVQPHKGDGRRQLHALHQKRG